MNLRTIDRFFSQSWHILPSAFETMMLSVLDQDKFAENYRTPDYIVHRPTIDAYGDEIARMRGTQNGVAIVPVHGALMANASGSDKYYYGVISHEDIAEDLDEAVNRGAEAILLDINSPGGTVAGTPELASKIDELAQA